jgi:undecaprenyl-diphosphatase
VNLLFILILGLVQGAAELLPVSSSAHVIVVEKLFGLDPSSPEMTFLLLMLHTGTMLAVIVYFWRSWVAHYFSSFEKFKEIVVKVVIATFFSGVVFLVLEFLIKKLFLKGGDIENLFSNLILIGAALLAVGVLIVYAGIREEKGGSTQEVKRLGAAWIGAVQGLAVPFRGFSRSGSTISMGLILGIGKRPLEEFSFALAVVLTPAAIGKELLRLLKSNHAAAQPLHMGQLLLPGGFGLVCSFAAGLFALWLLSKWLEEGRWKFFGFYCLVFGVVVLGLGIAGF